MIQQFLQRIRYGLRQFMTGRYGTDKLNMTILIAGMLISIVSNFMPWYIVRLLLFLLSYGLLIWALFRTFSRNLVKRRRENARWYEISTHCV